MTRNDQRFSITKSKMGDNRVLFDKSQTNQHNLNFFLEKYFLKVPMSFL